MTMQVAAVYEKGVLHLKDALPLPDGAAVQVVVIRETPAANGQNPAAILAAIAALPMEAVD